MKQLDCLQQADQNAVATAMLQGTIEPQEEAARRRDREAAKASV